MSVKKLCDDFRKYAETKRAFNLDFQKKYHPRVSICEFAPLLRNKSFWLLSQESPVALKFDPGLEPQKGKRSRDTTPKHFLVFQNRAYCVKGIYSEEELQLLVLNAFDAERRKFEHLRNLFAAGKRTNTERVRHIPEDVRIAVWRRDGGKCVKCGSQDRLEYDHVIPFSMGGSDTTRNVQLLCERCNRRKGGRIQ